MRRVLLIAPAEGYRTTSFLDAARKLGVEVTIAGDADVPADRHAVLVPLDDPDTAVDRIVASDAARAVDAVLALDDGGVEIAASASERLGLAHPPLSAVGPTRDKAELRRRLDVPQPDWSLVEVGDDAAAAASELGWPVVLKPRHLAASRGVIRADTPDEARTAHARIRRIVAEAAGDPDEPILVESFVPGAEVAVEALAGDEGIDVLAVFDKPDVSDGPYFEETIYVTPSRLPVSVLDDVERLVARAAAGLGLTGGAIHAEARVPSAGAPVLLEIAARSIGGACSRSLRFGLDATLEELILRRVLGLPRTGQRAARAASGVLMIPIPAPGVFDRVDGQDDVLALPGVESIEITVHAGAVLRPAPEADRYLGFVFAHGPDAATVEDRLREANESLEVIVT